MSKQTPRPWKQDGTHVIGPDNQVVAVCRQAKPRNTIEAIANARLIAAAPELSEACQEAYGTICELADWIAADPEHNVGLLATAESTRRKLVEALPNFQEE